MRRDDQGAGTDRDEGQATGPGDGAPDASRVEAEEGADRGADLLALDPPLARTTHDDGHLLLPGTRLVMLDAFGTRR
jgi:hypothetical protein